MFSPHPKPTVVVESTSARRMAWNTYHVLPKTIGAADFTVDSDRQIFGPEIQDICVRQQEVSKATGDIPMYRLIEATLHVLLEKTGREINPSSCVDDWMHRFRFQSPHDESHSGWTPLRFAAINGQLEIAKALLDQGVDVRAPFKKLHELVW